MAAPAGTFLAKVRNGVIQFPPLILRWCEDSRWTLFDVRQVDEDCLEIRPVLPGDDDDETGEFRSSLSPDGRLWIPEAVRKVVALGEQSVMMRVEEGSIRIYLRKVFATLGFRP